MNGFFMICHLLNCYKYSINAIYYFITIKIFLSETIFKNVSVSVYYFLPTAFTVLPLSWLTRTSGIHRGHLISSHS